MKRAMVIALTAILLVVGIDRFQWYTGRVPLSNMLQRAREGAPDARINGYPLMYHGSMAMNIADLKPIGQTDGGKTYYHVRDWPDGRPGGWVYIPKSDHVSYRYASPHRPGTVQ